VEAGPLGVLWSEEVSATLTRLRLIPTAGGPPITLAESKSIRLAISDHDAVWWLNDNAEILRTTAEGKSATWVALPHEPKPAWHGLIAQNDAVLLLSSASSDHSVQILAVGKSEPVVNVVVRRERVLGFALAGDAAYVYWAESLIDQPITALHRQPLAAGAASERLWEGPRRAEGRIALAASESFLYLAEGDNSGAFMHRFPKEGGPPTDSATRINNAYAIAATDTSAMVIHHTGDFQMHMNQPEAEATFVDGHGQQTGLMRHGNGIANVVYSAGAYLWAAGEEDFGANGGPPDSGAIMIYCAR
jgi:hypothetical protein